MNKIKLSDIKEYIKSENVCGQGKEVTVYKYGEKVIKIFHQNRTSPFELISLEGLIKLSDLPLQYFNKPIELIEDNDNIIGFTEARLIKEEVTDNLENIDFAGIKEDIRLLSENGFRIQDINYNYVICNGQFYFYDLTSYQYVPTKNDFLIKRFYQNNIKEMNIFLIGFIHFNAFQTEKDGYEFTKIYKANEYRLNYCSDEFYGDVINSKHL